MAEVNLKEPEHTEYEQPNRDTAILIGNILVALMMICVSVAVIQLGHRLAPTWNGLYLVFLALFMAIESVYTHNLIRELEFRERMTFRISEWVAFAVGIKILLYLVNGVGQFLIDLRNWQEDFLSFFTPEYMISLALAALVWFTSKAYTVDLEQLYDRDQDSSWDDLGKLQNELQEIRGRIIRRLFMIGAGIVIIAVLCRVDASAMLRSFGAQTEGYNAPIVNVIVYFLLALILLSQTQLALLQTRWSWQHVVPSVRVAGNWLRYSLIFFIVLSLVAILLPTEYSLGLFSTLRILLDGLIRVFSFILFLIMFPLTLLSQLFQPPEQRPDTSQPPPTFSAPPLEPGGPQTAIPWWDFVKSLLFWTVFIAVISFAIIYYLRQNTHLWNLITRFPLMRWLSRGWRGLKNWLRGGYKGVRSLVADAVKRIRSQPAFINTQAFRRMFDPRKLSPREKVLYFYLNLIQLSGERGLVRRPSQTPYQYEQELDAELPEVQAELQDLTGAFMEARYTQHDVDQPFAEHTGSLWDRIKAVLRSWRKNGR